MKAIIIAGTHSGVGKTTVSIALMRAFINMGKKVAPFKVGPDYIDPKFHIKAAKQKSYNLDSWFLNDERITILFHKHSKGKDISLVEGVMGLYDGSGNGTIGSTAHIAKILKAPIILVIDAEGIYTSINALILGYKLYDKEVNIKGVLLNNISSESHYRILKEIIEEEIDVECVGYFPKNFDVSFNSRHLGLIPTEEVTDIEEKIEILGKVASKKIDLEKLEELANIPDIEPVDSYKPILEKIGEGLKIAVARDEAFSFYYEDNLELMEECGIELIEFSPLHEKELPKDINGVYLGGGFPEVFSERLSKNVALLNDISDKINDNLPIFGECGGLMYLTRGIIDKEGNFHQLVSFFDCKSKMTEKLQRFGYVEVNYEGVITKAHEFHHSKLVDIVEEDFTYKYEVKKFNSDLRWRCGLAKKNVLAGYAHVHFYSNFEFFKKIIELFRRQKR